MKPPPVLNSSKTADEPASSGLRDVTDRQDLAMATPSPTSITRSHGLSGSPGDVTPVSGSAEDVTDGMRTWMRTCGGRKRGSANERKCASSEAGLRKFNDRKDVQLKSSRTGNIFN